MAGVRFSRVELVVEHKVHVRDYEAFKAQIQFQKIPGVTTAGSKDKTFRSGVRVFDIYEVVASASVYARDTCLSPTR